jgi:hypothetical protein
LKLPLWSLEKLSCGPSTNVTYLIPFHQNPCCWHQTIDRFRSRTRTSKTTWKWRVVRMYGYATPFWRHFHVVFDVRVLGLNLSNIGRASSLRTMPNSLANNWSNWKTNCAPYVLWPSLRSGPRYDWEGTNPCHVSTVAVGGGGGGGGGGGRPPAPPRFPPLRFDIHLLGKVDAFWPLRR